MASFILTLTAEDRVGLVAAVTGFLADHDGFILDSQQYADLETGRFFMRVEFKSAGAKFPASIDALKTAFASVAEEHRLDWQLNAGDAPPSIVYRGAVADVTSCLRPGQPSCCLLRLHQTQRTGINAFMK